MLDLTNHFLVAMPNVTNDLFSGSVVYVTTHSFEQGAVGVIVNKPLGKRLKNAFKDLDLAKYNPQWLNNQLYLGGPVNSENGFVLCRSTSVDVDGRMFKLSNSRSVLSEIATSNDKDNLFISVGYSAWGSFQIEDEICRNDWLVVKADASLIFDVDANNRYGEALRLLGINNISSLYAGGTVFA